MSSRPAQPSPARPAQPSPKRFKWVAVYLLCSCHLAWAAQCIQQVFRRPDILSDAV